MPPDRMLAWFAYSHLSEALQEVSKPFHDLAHSIAEHCASCLRRRTPRFAPH